MGPISLESSATVNCGHLYPSYLNFAFLFVDQQKCIQFTLFQSYFRQFWSSSLHLISILFSFSMSATLLPAYLTFILSQSYLLHGGSATVYQVYLTSILSKLFLNLCFQQDMKFPTPTALKRIHFPSHDQGIFMAAWGRF